MARSYSPHLLALVLGLSSLVYASSASALQQPDGTVVPSGNNLVTFLNAEGESINPLTDAAITPQTFSPQCSLTFTVIGRGAGQMNSFGWYNVTGTKPTPQELYEFITCSDGVGTVKTLDVRSDSRYLGGEIGFFQATTQGKPGNCANWADVAGTIGYFYYSEDRYNDDNVPGNPSNWIHLLIMNTTRADLDPAFYFGWEDLFSGGDNDFEDLLMRVEGIRCSGGGQPCETNGIGKCAFGTTQCVNGSVECLQNEQPTAEKCNALDDDCNGETDEGDLCDLGLVCDRGVCRPSCNGGEFKCPTGFECENDLCIDIACVGKTCDAGKICVAGECKAPCDGVVCPHGKTCRQGACVDPCEGVTCESDYYCDPGVGVCVLGCGCTGCGAGQTCSQATSACVQSACETVTCAAGTHCVDGNCIDDCDGAQCPTGQKCEAGGCVPDDNASGGAGGASAGGSGNIGIGGTSFGGSSTTGGSGVGAAAGTSSGDGGALIGRGDTTEGDSGCGCRTSGSQGSRAAWWVALALVLLPVRRRRFRAEKQARRV